MKHRVADFDSERQEKRGQDMESEENGREWTRSAEKGRDESRTQTMLATHHHPCHFINFLADLTNADAGRTQKPSCDCLMLDNTHLLACSLAAEQLWYCLDVHHSFTVDPPDRQ